MPKNERILNLSKKAAEHALGESTKDITMYLPNFAEKLSELIIKECANYASRNWEHGHLLAQDLKTHFGFEE